jgi:hypothetical protein
MMPHSGRYDGNCRPIGTLPVGCLTRSVVLHANVLALSPNNSMQRTALHAVADDER